jgi:hypothetical protein
VSATGTQWAAAKCFRAVAPRASAHRGPGEQDGPAAALEPDHHRLGLVGRGVRAMHRVGRGQGRGRGIAQQVLGQHDRHRPRHPLRGAMEGAHHRLADLAGVVHLVDRLGHGAEELGIVDLLEGAAAALLARHLADQHHDGHRVLLGDMDGDRAVRGAGAAADGEHAHAAGHLGLGHRHEAGARFMPAGDGGDPGVAQRVEQRQIAFARHAIEALEALRLQRAHDLVGDPLVIFSAPPAVRSPAAVARHRG